MKLLRSSAAPLALLLGAAVIALPAGLAASELRAPAFSDPGRLQVAQGSVTADVQRSLNDLGYDAGPVDGLMGARTRSAIESYQRSQNLLVDGQPTSALLDHLRGTLRSRAEAAPAPAASQQPAQQPAQEAVSADVVAGIQAELRRRGFDIPSVSGRVDGQTRAAIRGYQEQRRLAVDGEATPALLADLQRTAADVELGVSTEQVAAVQRALNERGYDAGPADGTMGPRSRTALRTFQADSNLEPSGAVTPATLQRLGIDAAATASPEPAAPQAEPGYATALSDNFSDGDFTANPAWRVAAGEFAIRRGGLNSVVEPQQAPRSAEEVGRQLLGNVLQQQLGVALPGQTRAAAAHVPARIAGAFRIEANLVARGEEPLRIDIGPYRGQNIAHGYRLSYNSQEQRPLRLLVVNEQGASVVATSALRFANEGRNTIRWEREANGAMRVSVDGETVLEARDATISGDFDGFSLINSAGDWTLRNVTVGNRQP